MIFYFSFKDGNLMPFSIINCIYWYKFCFNLSRVQFHIRIWSPNLDFFLNILNMALIWLCISVLYNLQWVGIVIKQSLSFFCRWWSLIPWYIYGTEKIITISKFWESQFTNVTTIRCKSLWFSYWKTFYFPVFP